MLKVEDFTIRLEPFGAIELASTRISFKTCPQEEDKCDQVLCKNKATGKVTWKFEAYDLSHYFCASHRKGLVEQFSNKSDSHRSDITLWDFKDPITDNKILCQVCNKHEATAVALSYKDNRFVEMWTYYSCCCAGKLTKHIRSLGFEYMKAYSKGSVQFDNHLPARQIK